MKRLNLAALFIVTLTSSIFFSCKKQYVCKCQIYPYGKKSGYNVQKDSILTYRKKKADKYCLKMANDSIASADSVMVCYAYTYNTRN